MRAGWPQALHSTVTTGRAARERSERASLDV